MKETLITLDTAKLAKEKGFKELVMVMYERAGRKREYPNINNKINKGRDWYSAPTQSLLQKWLREMHKIDVTITWAMEYYVDIYDLRNGARGCHVFKGAFQLNKGDKVNYKERTIGDFNVWEDALEVGLQEALKLIKP